VDGLVRVAIEEGVPPVEAYRMVTLNPAAYYGKDADLGGIAPGRYADVLLLDDLAEPRPRAVLARGRLVARDGRLLARVPEPPWQRIFTARATRFDRRWRVAAEDFAARRAAAGDPPREHGDHRAGPAGAGTSPRS
jgi:adenine deaminase